MEAAWLAVMHGKTSLSSADTKTSVCQLICNGGESLYYRLDCSMGHDCSQGGGAEGDLCRWRAAGKHRGPPE